MRSTADAMSKHTPARLALIASEEPLIAAMDAVDEILTAGGPDAVRAFTRRVRRSCRERIARLESAPTC